MCNSCIIIKIKVSVDWLRSTDIETRTVIKVQLFVAKRNRISTQTVINRRIEEGRGRGSGCKYQPWLRVQDVASGGLATRIKGWKTNRVHHFLSNLELNYFYILEWSVVVCDIREQYPLLPLSETIAIAQQCGIRHPIDPQTQQPVVMTTDFLISRSLSIKTTQIARTIKPTCHLHSQRVLEKLEIERRYWHTRDIDWGIVTEHEIPFIVAKNVEWLHPFHSTEDLSPHTKPEIERIARALNRMMTSFIEPLADMAAVCDDQLGKPPGTSLSVARYLIANRQWLVDMNQPIQPSEPLVLLAAPFKGSSPTAGGVQ